jgi:hypothetical protein
MDKESWRRGGDSRPDPRGETSFDELAKGLANGTISRRQALRWMGGTLVGGVLASIPGVALAQAGGNSACDEFCHANFSGRAAGQCTSAGAHGTGPCYTCTRGIGPGPHFTPPPCGPNEEFNPETCECEVIGCSGGSCGSFPSCNNDPNCLCFQTAEGSGLCWNRLASQFCDEYQQCTTSLDCPTGQLCAVSTCCPFGICIPPDQICPPQGVAVTGEAQQPRVSAQDRLTPDGR